MARHAVVVGGGAVGTACAYSLQRSGFDVTLIDQGELGNGCSLANCGLIVPSHSMPVPGPGVVREGLGYLTRRDGPFTVRPRLRLVPWLLSFVGACGAEAYRRGSESLVALSRAGLDLFEELAGEEGTGFGFRRGPLIHAYVSREGLATASAEVEELVSLGIGARRVALEELKALEPALGPRVLGGVVIEDQAWADPLAFVTCLAGLLRRGGARILEQRTVERIHSRTGRPTVSVTPKERIEADIVVLAAGAWSPALAAPLGLRIPIQPATGYSSTFAAPAGGPALPIVLPERRVVLTPLGDRLRFGGTLELSGFRSSPDARRYRAVVRGGLEALRPDVTLADEEPWYGFRPLTSDGLPVIGWAPRAEGILVATGHGMLGFTQATITGRLIAQLADGERPSIPLHAFRPDRFSRRILGPW